MFIINHHNDSMTFQNLKSLNEVFKISSHAIIIYWYCPFCRTGCASNWYNFDWWFLNNIYLSYLIIKLCSYFLNVINMSIINNLVHIWSYCDVLCKCKQVLLNSKSHWNQQYYMCARGKRQSNDFCLLFSVL